MRGIPEAWRPEHQAALGGDPARIANHQAEDAFFRAMSSGARAEERARRDDDSLLKQADKQESACHGSGFFHSVGRGYATRRSRTSGIWTTRRGVSACCAGRGGRPFTSHPGVS
jgi:hypothetical protein